MTMSENERVTVDVEREAGPDDAGTRHAGLNDAEGYFEPGELARRRLTRHVVPGDARRAQRAAQRRRRGTGRVRQRLPRRHLRHVRPDDQRPSPRPDPHHHLPTAYAFVRDGDTITIEPWRATAFPVLKDLCVDRRAFDRIIAAGGYISVNTGAAPDAHAMPVPKDNADRAFDAATCIGCGACVAACPNASAALFLGAKITHLGQLPQGQAERDSRVVSMTGQHDAEGFGGCSNIGECASACPKEIPIDVISQLNRDL